MSLLERKKLIVTTIRKLEDMLCKLKHCDERPRHMVESEMENLQRHLHSAHSVLVLINEEELNENRTD